MTVDGPVETFVLENTRDGDYYNRLFGVKNDMLTEKELMCRATDELIRVFGRKYLQDNYRNTCKAYGMVDDDTFQSFIGIKGFDDLPHRKANAKGWVVHGTALIDANTGELKSIEYELE